MSKHLTPAEKERFVEAYALTRKPIISMIAAQPKLATDRNYANVKARRQLAKPDIQDKIQKKLELMSKKATKRIDKLIQSDNEQIATTNAWKVIEHVRGTPINRSITGNFKLDSEDILANLK
jgi:hypothetical protein